MSEGSKGGEQEAKGGKGSEGYSTLGRAKGEESKGGRKQRGSKPMA